MISAVVAPTTGAGAEGAVVAFVTDGSRTRERGLDHFQPITA